jgi:hypothetical protein
VPLFSPPRTVLILSDEGLQIYRSGRLGARYIDFIPWETEDFTISVSNLIAKKCRRQPVVILNDMVEQHYRKELIPKVSPFDRVNVIKRRLGIAFPNYKIRAALRIKDKKTPVKGEAKGDPYLFAAIPASDQFNKTLEAIRMSMAPIVGLFLLPIEGSAMVRDLSAKLTKKQRYKPAWTIFIGQHNNGSLRQIVTRNGQLALTRMTPIVDTDVEPELWAKEVSGELNATMSYLARFGYKDTDGLNVIIVANQSSQTSLETFIDIECDLNVMDAQQIASTLGINLGRQEDYRYADPLHAAYLGGKTRYLLPMQSAAITNLTKPRRVASYVLFALIAGCAYFGFMAFQGWQTAVEIQDQLVVAKQQNSSLKQEYQLELDKKRAMGFDFALVNNSLEIFEELEDQKIFPLPVAREIGRSLGTDLHLDKLEVSHVKETIEKDINDQDYNPDAPVEVRNLLDAIMTLSFPNTINPDVGVQKINTLQSRLQGNLPNYEVSIVRQVADLSYTGNFVGGSGEAETEGQTPERYEAEIRIRTITADELSNEGGSE